MAVARNNQLFAGCIALLVSVAASRGSNATPAACSTLDCGDEKKFVPSYKANNSCKSDNCTKEDDGPNCCVLKATCNNLVGPMTGGCLGIGTNNKKTCAGPEDSCTKQFCCDPFPTCGSYNCSGANKVLKGSEVKCTGSNGCNDFTCCKDSPAPVTNTSGGTAPTPAPPTPTPAPVTNTSEGTAPTPAPPAPTPAPVKITSGGTAPTPAPPTPTPAPVTNTSEGTAPTPAPPAPTPAPVTNTSQPAAEKNGSFVSISSTLSQPVIAGATSITVDNTDDFKVGDSIKLEAANTTTTEYAKIINITSGRRLLSNTRRLAAGSLVLDRAIQNNFTQGVTVQTVSEIPTPAPTPAPTAATTAPPTTPAPTTPAPTTAATVEKSSSSADLSGSSSFESLPSGKSSSSGSLTSGSGTAWMWVALFIGLICCIGGLIGAACSAGGKKKRSTKKKKPTKTTEPVVAPVTEASPMIVSETAPLLAPAVYTTTQVAAPTYTTYEVAAPVVAPTYTTYEVAPPVYSYAQPTPTYTYAQPSVL